MKRIQEWINKYNPFNSIKALAHVEYWKSIKHGVYPPPIFVSIDPSGKCNYNCGFCNASETIKKHSDELLSIDNINTIIKMLKDWKTRTTCIGGGGEPLMNANTGYLVDLLHYHGVRIGLVTNGSYIHKFIPQLKFCEWVGISVDAGTAETYKKVKGVKADLFHKVLKNIEIFAQSRTKEHNPEITYKFLLHPNNYKDILEATKIAKNIGCDVIHIRPGGNPWFNLQGNEFHFSHAQVQEGKEAIEEARSRYEDEFFKVFGIMHKFSMNWTVRKYFKNCYAGCVTCYIDHNGVIGLCCDRRGDDSLILGHISLYKELWGSEKHKEIMRTIDLLKCPRCTYSHVNEIFENVIFEDRMMYDFF
jgi:wyosine [tRNA(Phe)-imidazoG37] synthetase (radical SAM superfamily)